MPSNRKMQNSSFITAGKLNVVFRHIEGIVFDLNGEGAWLDPVWIRNKKPLPERGMM